MSGVTGFPPEDDHGGHLHHDEHDEFHVENSSSAAAGDGNGDGGDGKPWGEVILASLFVQLVTFSGLFVLWTASRVAKRGCTGGKFWKMFVHLIVPSFASGALLATCVFLLVPESLHLLAGGHSAHASAADGHDDHGDVHGDGPTSFEEIEHVEQVDDQHAGHDDHAGHGHHRIRFLQAAHEEDEGNSENAVAWKFGASLMGGFLIPILLGIFFPDAHHSDDTTITGADEEIKDDGDDHNDKSQEPPPRDEEEETAAIAKTDGGEEKKEQAVRSGDDADAGIDGLDTTGGAVAKSDTLDPGRDTTRTSDAPTLTVKTNNRVDWQLASSILIGDGFHNFVDGIFIGNAFLLCDRRVAWTIVATTIYHEIAQEIADFALLTTKCGLPVWKALALNFCSGFSVLIGAFIVFALDLTPQAKGVLLSMSGGVYVFIAAVECVPRLRLSRRRSRDTLYFLLWFVVGAVPIGLVLLNHGHCDGGGHDAH